uniref:Uncharacterized protein n=1 Tax=Rhizophora mucronata TaxID=61149 RepID=A0A2P2Q854_RHIMU
MDHGRHQLSFCIQFCKFESSMYFE